MTDSTSYTKTFEMLQEQYLVTIQESLSQIETRIIKLQECDNINEKLFSILGDIHSIKGSSGSYDFNFLSIVCHSYEDLISNFLHHSPEEVKKEIDIDKMLKFLDVTKEIVSYHLTGTGTLEDIKQKFYNLTLDHFKPNKIYKILLVESVQLLSRAIVLTLQNEGYEVSVAKDGYEALGRILNEDFDIVISSQSLKILDGNDLIKCIKSIQRPDICPHTILLTSNKHTPIQNVNGPDMIFFKNSQMVDSLTNYLNELEENYHSKTTNKVKNDSIPHIKRILYIDDDETISPLVRLGLQRNMVPELKFLLTGKEILNEAKIFKPDLVFLDYHLPDMNGPEVLKIFRSDKNFEKIPVIFITGITGESEKSKICSLGANAVISKPFRVKSLREQVNAIWQGIYK